MSINDLMIIASFFIIPLAVLLLHNLLPRRASESFALPALGVTALLALLAAVWQFCRLLTQKLDFVNFSFLWEMEADKSAYFSMDILSTVMLICIALSVLSAALTARDTLKPDKIGGFTNLSLVLLLAMNGIVMVSDLFAFYVFLEATGIATFVLVALYKDSDGLEGSFKYFIMSALATAAVLIGMIFVFINTGSLSYAALSSAAAVPHELMFDIGLTLLLVGLCIKAGITPFHGWVPDAYQAAPAPVSVLMGGSITKICGIYGLYRVFGVIFTGIPLINNLLLIFALLAIVFGAFAAMAQNDFKRILAYSSISQLGYIALAIATGSPLALVGAAMHFFNHAVFKGNLFVNAAVLEKEVGTLDIREMGGLSKQLPVTGVSSVLSFFSAAGLPPFSGFWSKLLIILAAWLAGLKAAAVIALLASLVTMGYFLRLQRNVFFGKSKAEFAHVSESGAGYKCAAVLLSVLTCAGGIIMPALLALLRAKGLI